MKELCEKCSLRLAKVEVLVDLDQHYQATYLLGVNEGGDMPALTPESEWSEYCLRFWIKQSELSPEERIVGDKDRTLLCYECSDFAQEGYDQSADFTDIAAEYERTQSDFRERPDQGYNFKDTWWECPRCEYQEWMSYSLLEDVGGFDWCDECMENAGVKDTPDSRKKFMMVRID